MATGTPPERTVGYGTADGDAALDVACGYCKASIGVPCRKRTHASRVDKARNARLRATYRLFSQMENAALAADPNGPLWSFTYVGHRCGVTGPHVMSACAPVAGAA